MSEQFGSTDGKSIDKGFVFIDGAFIETPYVISRRGLSIYVNHIKIERPSRHEGMPVIPGYENPDSLSPAEKQRLFRQLEATRAIYEKYLSRNYGYLFFSKGGHIRLNPETAAYDLPDIINILRSKRTKEEKLKELLPYNWHLSEDVNTIIDNFHFNNQISSRLNQLAEELLKIDEYGKNSEAPVDEGFLFSDGQYIPTPYRVERKGLSVFINGYMIERPLYVPEKIFFGDTDPKIPKEINSESCVYDEVVHNYLAEKQMYLHKHKSREEEAVLAAQLWKGLPFITKAIIDENQPNTIYIETNDGISLSAGLVALGDRGVKYDKESVIKRIDSQRKHYQATFENGGCYMIFKRGGTIHFSSSFKEILVKMAGILNDDNMSNLQKYSEIRKSGINMPDEELAKITITPQLKSRIEKLNKKEIQTQPYGRKFD